MDITGKSVTVTVEGFGSKSGVVDAYAPDDHRMCPYHVAFDDGAAGWFDGEQCGLSRWVSGNEAVGASLFMTVYDNSEKLFRGWVLMQDDAPPMSSNERRD